MGEPRLIMLCGHGETDDLYHEYTVADLVAALLEEGAGEVAETLKEPYQHRLPVSEPGRYLVVRIDKEDK